MNTGWTYKAITRNEFDDVYDKYPPKKWVKFAFKYFSKNTEKKDVLLSNTITYVLVTTFLIGFFATVMGWPRAVIGAATIIYASILSLLVGFLFAAVISNNRRLKKIIKELNISKWEYNELVDEFYK